MAGSAITIYVDGTQVFSGMTSATVIVNSTGLLINSSQVYTYSGDNDFLGFSTSSGGTLTYEIGDTIVLSSTGDYFYLYTVDSTRINKVKIDDIEHKINASSLDGHAMEQTGISSNTTTIPTTAQVKSYVDGRFTLNGTTLTINLD